MPVVVNGVSQFLKALKEIEDDTFDNVKARLKTPMIRVAALTKNEFPDNQSVLSGWLKTAQPMEGQTRPFPAYDQAKAQAGVKYKLGPNKKNRNGYAVYNYVSNESAAGAIYETAGRKTSGQGGASLNPNAGIQFIAALPGVEDATMAGSVGRRGRKNKGRVIFKAWKEEQGDAYKAIEKAINDAVFDYYKKLPLEKKGQVLGFYKERSARGFKGL